LLFGKAKAPLLKLQAFKKNQANKPLGRQNKKNLVADFVIKGL
jgi:hypothetical protein